MRILLLAPQPFYEDRGTPIGLAHVLQSLSRQQIAVDLVTFPVGQDVELPGLRIARAGPRWGIRRVPVGFSLRKLLFDAALTCRAWRLAYSGRYDCIQAVEEAVLPALVLGRMFGLPVIYDMQSSMPEQLGNHPLLGSRLVQRMLCRLEAWFVREAAVVACSAGLEKLVLSIKPAAIVEPWSYPGVFPTDMQSGAERMRAALGIPRAAPVIYYGGTFESYQGLDYLLASMPAVLSRVPDAVFILLGASGGETLAGRLPPGVSPASYRILPRQTRALSAQYLAIADVVISPRSRGRNLPLKVIDYMAAGKPIIATDQPAHRSVLDETRALLVQPSGDALAAGIIELLVDRRRAARLGAAARAHAQRAFGIAQFDAQVARIVTAAIARRMQAGALRESRTL